MNKDQVAEVLQEIGTLLELQGENPFKTRAYLNAARTIGRLEEPLEAVIAAGRLGALPGIGAALRDRITELAATGRLAYYEELKAAVPAGLRALLEIPGLGPRKIKALRDAPPLPKTRLQWRKADIAIGKGGVEATERGGAQTVVLDETDIELPDLLTQLQDRTQLTRRTICRILTGCGRLDDFKRNPQAFIELAAEAINRCKRLAIVDGIKYQRLGDEYYYAQELFEQEELTGYIKNMLTETSKSVFESVVYDSGTEAAFADGLEKNEAGTPSSGARDHIVQLNKRARKLALHDYGDMWADIEGDGELAVLTFGSSTGPVREAIVRAAATGVRAKLVAMRLIAPALPEKLDEALAGVKHVLVVEQNHGAQLYRYLRSMYDLPGRPASFHRPGPLPLRPAELATAIIDWQRAEQPVAEAA